LRSLILLVAITVNLAAADPPWKKLGTRLTPQGTLCRTVELRSDSWERTNWGLLVGRGNGSASLAYNSDGGSLERYAQRSVRYYFWTLTLWDISNIVLPGSGVSLYVDHRSKEYQVLHGASKGQPVWDPEDADCSTVAKGLGAPRRFGQAQIAGFLSFGYTGWVSEAERSTLFLAPSLGCTLMKSTEETFGSAGSVVAHHQIEVTMVRIGEPDPKLFEVPPDSHRRSNRLPH